jgi:2-amino-4-hydroxy-6-hydroxymethyldihydropteridine diphosphokinase
VRWGPRTLDLDIVLIDGVEHSDDTLTVPHPELPNRDFWLRQLAELRGVSDG